MDSYSFIVLVFLRFKPFFESIFTGLIYKLEINKDFHTHITHLTRWFGINFNYLTCQNSNLGMSAFTQLLSHSRWRCLDFIFYQVLYSFTISLANYLTKYSWDFAKKKDFDEVINNCAFFNCLRNKTLNFPDSSAYKVLNSYIHNQFRNEFFWRSPVPY